ncbi:hypothetical protein [Asanoa iriomotensis]|nr:hypothetical protein [Asanoa iriomotensis]
MSAVLAEQSAALNKGDQAGFLAPAAGNAEVEAALKRRFTGLRALGVADVQQVVNTGPDRVGESLRWNTQIRFDYCLGGTGCDVDGPVMDTAWEETADGVKLVDIDPTLYGPRPWEADDLVVRKLLGLRVGVAGRGHRPRGAARRLPDRPDRHAAAPRDDPPRDARPRADQRRRRRRLVAERGHRIGRRGERCECARLPGPRHGDDADGEISAKYGLSYYASRCIDEKYGRKKLPALVDAVLRNGEDAAAASQRILGAKWTAVESACLSYSRKAAGL